MPKDGYMDLFGLNHQVTAKIATLFDQLSTSRGFFQHQELIKSLGDEYMTLTKNVDPTTTRIQTALNLSHYTS